MSRKGFLVFLTVIAAMTANAGDRQKPDENFMLVLRQTEGSFKPDFGFEPVGPVTAKLDDGQEFTENYAWFRLIGDISVRFVIDGERTMRNLFAEEFSEFGMTPEQAAAIAVANIRARYGAPSATPWEDGISLVAGESPDLDSSYFLDGQFWHQLSQAHPEGLVVGVPKRGGLIYAPVADPIAVALLKRDIADLYETSGNMRISAGLYLFKAGKWAVYREPGPQN